jgi:ABC-2 type transport system ATP-binding protein
LIELRNASRWYGQVIGLNDVSCTIEPGVTALLGMNGAGKTTMMRLITGQLRPTTGEVTVFGLDPFANPAVYRRLGYCPDVDNFYEFMTGRVFVELMARMSGFSAGDARIRADDVLRRVGMAERADRKIGGYSKGMRQRIKLAQAILHDPEIILLDEPLNGLDPVGRRDFIDLLTELGGEGRAIVVSSHILFEVEQMTRSLLLLHRGRLLARGDLRVIRELIDKHPHRIRIETPDPRQVAERLAGLPYVLSLQFDPGGRALEIQTREADRFYSHLPRLAIDDGLAIDGFSSPDNNLESVFAYLVGG